jgi:hypothetical protein
VYTKGDIEGSENVNRKAQNAAVFIRHRLQLQTECRSDPDRYGQGFGTTPQSGGMPSANFFFRQHRCHAPISAAYATPLAIIAGDGIE